MKKKKCYFKVFVLLVFFSLLIYTTPIIQGGENKATRITRAESLKYYHQVLQFKFPAFSVFTDTLFYIVNKIKMHDKDIDQIMINAPAVEASSNQPKSKD